ncbi:MAG: MBOAT family protein [Myxococcales bacterium]|nr:MBOAT family protein [Myxococcales bacterium]
MLFPSVEFALFFVVVFCCAWSLAARPSRWKSFLLVASGVFYASWNYRYLPLLVALAVGNHALANRIRAARTDNDARTWITLAVALDLGVLFVFKYLGWVIASFVTVCTWFGARPRVAPVQLALPLGVSFVTFQAMSYAIDAYRARGAEPPDERARPASDVLLYVSFFPHLVAGPIVRASEFFSQLRALKVPSREERTSALLLIAGGLAKKVVLASWLARAIVDPVFAQPESSSWTEILAAIYGYAVQIYADFSGYTDMAIGLAALLGVTFPQNFAQPYRAASLRDFWRRWHMTLSRWLRDYLFVSLGGSRGSRAQTLRNLFLTMLLGGLWHGAAWTFVLWGALHGVGLALERWIDGDRESHTQSTWVRAARTVFTFHFVCLGWVLFRASSLRDARVLLERLFVGARGSVSNVPAVTPALVAGITVGIAMHFLPPSLRDAAARRLARWHPVALGLAGGALLAAMDLVSPPGIAPFIYFQF